MVHWYRNVMSVVPKGKVKEVMAMLKAIHAQEDRQAAATKLRRWPRSSTRMRLSQAATIVRDGRGRDAVVHGVPARALDAYPHQ